MLLLTLCPLSPLLAADLPPGFVHLKTIAPDIRQHMAYAGSDNFLGRPAKGYDAAACILTEKAARALTGAQQALSEKNLSLVVFDCYRPASAVTDFVSWVQAGGDIDARWSPKVARKNLIIEGYIGRRSAHSRGSTVDVAIVTKGEPATSPKLDCGIASPNMLEFATGFDCFDRQSNTAFLPLPQAAIDNRKTLLAAMANAGFKNYAGEWWHFTLRGEPFPNKRFDFPVTGSD